MRKLWTVLLAVSLVTGLAFTGCGEIPNEAAFTLVVEREGDADYAGNPRIQGTIGVDILITGLVIVKGEGKAAETVFDLAEWCKTADYIGGSLLGYAGNPTYVTDKTAGTILITNRGAGDYLGIDLLGAGIGFAADDDLTITLTGVSKIGAEIKIGGSSSPYPTYGTVTVTE